MSVLTLSSDGLTIACLTFPHEWSVAFALSHRFATSITAGQSGREARRPRDEALRFAAGVHLVLTGDEAQEFRQLLATIGPGWVGLPLWPDKLTGAQWSDRIYDAERLLDLTAGAIVNKGATLDDAHDYVPLLVGHLETLPELPADSSETVDFEFTVLEDSPWAFRIGINATATPGTWPAGLAPDWTESPMDQPAEPLQFEQIGEQRERTIDNLESIFSWGQEAHFTLGSRAEIRALLAFFLASEGPRRAFTTPWWLHPGTPTAEAPATTSARFADDSLTLDFAAAHVAGTKLRVRQVPWEIEGVAGEDPVQPPRVFLYKFTHALPTPQVWRFTNWPRPLARTADGTYQPGPFKHDRIVETLDLRGLAVAIRSFQFAGNPLLLFRPDATEAPLLLEIRETETWPVDPDAAVLRWTGEMKRPTFDGRHIDAPGVFQRGLLERELPRVLASTHCRTELFSTRCKLVRATFEKTGTFAVKNGCVLDITTAAADAAQTFLYGVVEIGSGATWEQRAIIASEPIAGGQRLTVDWPVRQAATGQAVKFYRGCNRTWTTCQALGNEANFRGLPHMPEVNLALPTMALPQAPGKK